MGSVRLLRSHPELVGLATVHFLYYLAHQSLQNVFVLYTGYRYGWTATDVGWALAVVGAIIAMVQGGLVGRVVAAIGERRTMLVGLTLGAGGFLIYGVAPTGFWFAAGIPVMSLWGLYGPAAQGLMTQRVGASEQGRLQGALSSVVGLTGIIGPLVFSATFAAFIGRWQSLGLPGAPFLLSALLLGIAFVVAWRATRSRARTGR